MMMVNGERTYTRPYIMDKNLGNAVDLDKIDLPKTNADGEPVVAIGLPLEAQRMADYLQLRENEGSLQYETGRS